jgi:hypothetical protein
MICTASEMICQPSQAINLTSGFRGPSSCLGGEPTWCRVLRFAASAVLGQPDDESLVPTLMGVDKRAVIECAGTGRAAVIGAVLPFFLIPPLSIMVPV